MAAEPAVLVTRPAGQADGLVAALAGCGFTPHHQPLLQLEALEVLPSSARQCAQDLDLYQHVIFISANAVRFGMDLIDDFWPQLPVGIHWYAIGDSTAALLAQRDVVPITPDSNMNSEGMLAVPQLSEVDRQRVLIVKGVGGRDRLREVLATRGARVDELACYRRRCPSLAPGQLAAQLQRWDVKFILISSGEGLQNLLALLRAGENTKFTDIGLVVPSTRVEKMAREAGFEQIKTAANASDTAMLQALQQWRSGE